MSTILVTGGARGIGLELVRQYAGRGDSVIACCRETNDALQASGARVIENVEVTDDASIAALAAELNGLRLDVLLNNAGILRADSLDNLDWDAMLRQFQVNALGPLRVTRGLLQLLDKGSKVGIVSSRVGSIADNGSGNNYGYRSSKTAANMIGINLHHDLSPRGISVALLHPGLVATDMTGGNGISPAEAAAGLIERMDELTLANSGGFWHANGERLPW